RDRVARGGVPYAALSPGWRNTVQPVDRSRQQFPVRLGEHGSRLAVALPLDTQTRQRHLHRLHPQLAEGPGARAFHDARSTLGVQSALHASILIKSFTTPVTEEEKPRARFSF